MFHSQTVKGKNVSRQRLIALQIEHIFNKVVPGNNINRVLDKGVIRNQWINKLEIQAYAQKEKIMGRFLIEIDWELFRECKTRFGPNILVPMDRLGKKTVAIWNVADATAQFKTFVGKSNLKTRWVVYTEEGLGDQQKFHKRMGVAKTRKFGWANGPKKTIKNESIKNLEEMTLFIETMEKVVMA